MQELLTKIVINKDRHKGYNKAVEHAEEMAVHIWGGKPVKLLNRVRPREDEEVKKYRLESYEPTTQSTAEKALSIVGKIFNPKIYAIRFDKKNKKQEELYKYCFEDYPYYNSLIDYFEQIVLKKMIGDPNGFLAVVPLDFEVKSNERVSPFVECYSSEDLHWFEWEEWYLFHDKTEKDKIYYYTYIDKTEIKKLRIERLSGKISVEEIGIYQHNFGDVPVWQLGGIIEQKKDQRLFKSFFNAALPFWNKAISAESDLDGAYINHMHPIRTELAEECDYVDANNQQCIDGFLTDPESGAKNSCPRCQGTGKRSVKSPYGVYMYNKEKLNDFPGGYQPVDFVSVPVEPTKMLELRVDKFLEKGLSALNMDIVNEIGENQSGIAKEYDRSELYSFLEKISSMIFGTHIYNAIWYINAYRHSIDQADFVTNMPEINRPTNFDINSLKELTEQLETAKKAGINPGYIKAKQMEVQEKEFSTNPALLRKLNLETQHDPLPEASVDDIQSMLNAQTITQTTAILHSNISYFISRAINEDESFTKKTWQERQDILMGYAEEIKEQNRVKIGITSFSEQS